MLCNKKKFKLREASHCLKVNQHSRKSYRREKRFYFCDSCQGWHLTSQDPLVKIENIKKLKFKDNWKKLVINTYAS